VPQPNPDDRIPVTSSPAHLSPAHISPGHIAKPCLQLEPAQVSRTDALAAIRTLLSYIGEDPDREGLRETPDRVLRSYGEFFAGYQQDAGEVLAKTFDETADYNGPVVVRDITVQSHCEHHMVAFAGRAHVAYLPSDRVVGLSKLARLVDVYARRLQIQERLTAQIANDLQQALQPRGVAVVIEAEHHCMTMRGVRKPGAITTTSHVTGVFLEDAAVRMEILRELRGV
jgi:GTP cyclohydrolase IA